MPEKYIPHPTMKPKGYNLGPYYFLKVFETTHKLPFLSAPESEHIRALLQLASDLGMVRNDDPYPHIPWQAFKIGTCEGQWRAVPDAYEILSVVNANHGNGHFTDVMEWFEHSCQRDKRALRIRCITNKRFKAHLIVKRGFIPEGKEDAIKIFSVNL